MRTFVPAALALVLGLLLGSWSPRGELIALREEIRLLRLERTRSRPSAAAGLREVFRAPPPAEPADRAPAEAGEDDGVLAPDEEGRPEPAPAREAGGSPIGDDEDFAAFKSALDARAAQARAALEEQGDLDEEALAEVDEVVARMNDQLQDAVDDFVADALEAGLVDRRMMLDLGADALDIAITADDGLRAAIPEEAYAGLDEAVVDPFSYIDGAAADALQKVRNLPGLDR